MPRETFVALLGRVDVLAPARLVVDLEDLGEALDAGDHGMRGRGCAERARELQMLRGFEVLLGEEDHLVLQQQRAQPGGGFGTERLAQVDAADVGADRCRLPA